MAFLSRQLGAAVIAVAAVAPLAGVWALVGGVLVATPWADAPMTPSQAIYHRDFAQAVRLLDAGASVTAEYPSPTPEQPGRRTTPMQEALRVHEPDLIRVLLDFGAAPDAGSRVQFACAALSYGDAEIAAMLLPRVPQAEECAALADRPLPPEK